MVHMLESPMYWKEMEVNLCPKCQYQTAVWKQTLWWRNCTESKWNLRRQCYTSIMSGYSSFIWGNILTGYLTCVCVCVLIHVWVERDERSKQISPLFLLNHSHRVWLTRKNWQSPTRLLQPNPLSSPLREWKFFFLSFRFASAVEFPL